jgi:transcriptional regulator of arginine metabolism
MKSKRQQKILELIETYNINTQEELISRLNEAGYLATQATISRDIRELNISKVLGANGKYHYTMSDGGDHTVRHSYVRSIRSAENACNLVVIKTGPGLAQAVAAEIDSMDIGELLGCVAGDDTIIAVAKTEQAAFGFCEGLKRKIGM